MKRTAAALFLTAALLLSTVALTQLTNPATANFICFLPTITIHSDGTVEPETGLIRQDGNVYTLTADVIREYAIIIQCSNIVFDGAGHTIDGSLPTLGYANEGFVVQGVTNVTVKNLEVTGFMSCDIVIKACYSCSFIGVKGEFDLQQSEHINISECVLGIYIRNSENIVITKSNISLGIERSSATFFENNFVNTPTRVLYATCLWDNGSVGNYWSDYDGADVNGDGIGDTPYVINANNRDCYPLMNPWHPTIPFDTVPPRISISSPENTVYNASSVPLSFLIYESSSSMSYSLDGQDNVTIAGNTTLGELPNGSHNLTVYVTDQSGNVGASDTIYFNVDAPEPFPVVPVAAASVATVVVVSVGLLVYFKKRKR